MIIFADSKQNRKNKIMGNMTKEEFLNAIKNAKDYIIHFLDILVCIWILAFLIRPTFESTVTDWICPYLDKVFSINKELKCVFDLIFCVIIIRLTFRILHSVPKRKIGTVRLVQPIVLLCIITTYWIYYRLIHPMWSYFMIFNSSIAYIDIIVLFIVISCFYLICYACIYKVNGATDQINKGTKLTFDDPIQKIDEDILNRKSFAKNFANRIKDLETKHGARSVAIVSPWGYGKTSFINLVCGYLKNDKKYIIIHFSPWHFNPGTNITNKFYEQVVDEFADINYTLSKWIKEYASFLEKTKLSFVPKFIHRTKPSIIKIGNRLNLLGFKVLIVIDDFDRLNSDEIEEVFRLIRGSANIPSFIFLSAFDKKYIQETLRKSSKAITEHYIEKFFELEFNLPDYDKKALEGRILSITNQFLLEQDKELFKEYISSESIFFETPAPYEILGNLRCIYRWLNNIQIKYDILKGECQISDLADLELLNMIYPDVYELLRTEYNRFLIKENGVYHLWNKEKADESSRWLYQMQHKDIYEEDKVKIITGQHMENLGLIMKRLLPISYHPYPNAFNNPYYTHRYFYQILQSTEISQSDFNKLLNKDFEGIKYFVDMDTEECYAQSLRLKCFEDDGTDANRSEKILHLIFYAAKSYKNFGCTPHIIDKHLSTASSSEDEKKKLLNVLAHENRFSLFVLSLFSYSQYGGRYFWSSLLTNEEMDTLLADMIKYAIEDKYKFQDILHIYDLTFKREFCANEATGKKTEVYKPIEKVSKIFKKYIAENFADIMPNLIQYDSQKNDDSFYLLGDFVTLWNNWNEFKNYCVNNGCSILEDNVTGEFCSFWEIYIENNKQSVQFTFSHINTR